MLWCKSVLGLYFNSARGIPKEIDLDGFADDHGYKNSFPAKSRNKETARINKLKEWSRDIKTWMDENRLKMNNSKTEFCNVWIETTSTEMYHKCNKHQWRRNTIIRLHKVSMKLDQCTVVLQDLHHKEISRWQWEIWSKYVASGSISQKLQR